MVRILGTIEVLLFTEKHTTTRLETDSREPIAGYPRPTGPLVGPLISQP